MQHTTIEFGEPIVDVLLPFLSERNLLWLSTHFSRDKVVMEELTARLRARLQK